MDEIEVSVDWFWMDCMVFLLLTGFADYLNGFHAMILLVPPVDDPYLVHILNVIHVDWVSIGHYHLFSAYYRLEKSVRGSILGTKSLTSTTTI